MHNPLFLVLSKLHFLLRHFRQDGQAVLDLETLNLPVLKLAAVANEGQPRRMDAGGRAAVGAIFAPTAQCRIIRPRRAIAVCHVRSSVLKPGPRPSGLALFQFFLYTYTCPMPVSASIKKAGFRDDPGTSPKARKAVVVSVTALRVGDHNRKVHIVKP